MKAPHALRQIRSATHGFCPALRIRTLAALMWAVFSVAGVPSAQAGINVWTKVGLPGGNVVTLAIDPTMPDTLYGGGDRGLFKSTDGGSTWSVNAGLTYPIGLYPPAGYPFPDGYPSVTALAIDPATPGSLFAGAIGGGVFKSTDGGNTWNASTSWWISPFIGVSALAIDPSTPGTLYAGFFAYYEVCLLCEGEVEAMPAGGGGPDFPGLGYGVFKSTDGGNTWNAASTGLDFGRSVYALAIDPTAPSILYAGTETGVFKSTDGGGTWDAILPGHVAALAIDPISPGTLYAGTPSGVFKSTNGGGTWDIAGWTGPVDALAIDPGAPATLYAATASCGSDGCGNKVYKSADGGGTWSATGLSEPYELPVLANTPIKVVLAIDPTTPSTLYAGMISGVFKKTDGARAWRRTTNGANDWVSALAVDPTTPNALYAGTRDQSFDGDGAGVSKSTDGGATWGAASTGLPTGIDNPDESAAFAINALAIDRTTPGIAYAGTNDGVFKSTDGGGTWSATGLTELYVNALAIDPGDPATLYAATYEDGLFKSTDGGRRWAPVDTGLNAQPSVFALAIDPITPTTLYAGTGGRYCVELQCYTLDGVIKSTDGGATWRAASTGLPTRSTIKLLVIDPTAPTTLYAATEYRCDEFGCYGSEGLFKSTDGGGTWTAASPGLSDVANISALAIDPTRPGTLYAATYDPEGPLVFKTTDGGGTWAVFDTGLDVYVESLAIDPTSPRTLYAGTRNGVFSIQQVGACLGDCDDSFAVGINELVRLVNIVLGKALASACPHGVPDGGAVDIPLLIQAVQNILGGCSFTAE